MIKSWRHIKPFLAHSEPLALAGGKMQRRAAILAIETVYEYIDESILKKMDYHSPAERIKLFEQSIIS